ncbi:MAG TPA: glycosyltransferase family 87 protein, partial [bacterium]|nr:glycosyltransferase family 87 protein [bacterium]
MFLKNKAADIFLKCSLALAAMISVVISSRLALKDIGDFQYNTAHKGSIGFRDFWNSTYYLFHGYNIFDPLIVQQFHLVSLYLPNSFLFFFPLVPLGPQWGKVCWLSVNLFLTVLLARQISVLFWDKKHFLILAALIACSAPWGILIYSGQFSLWSLYFFLLALQWDKENRPILSGLAIAFCLLKYALTVPLLLYFLVYRRSWKGVVLGVGIQAALFGFFCLYMNLTPWEL